MKRNFGKLALLLTSCGIVALGVGCAGAGTTNNDQGITVTFLGYFSEFAGACTATPQGVAGGTLQMSTAKPEPAVTLGDGVFAGTDAGSNFVAVVGVQNNLFSQIFRADRMIYDYFIAGASIQPPSTNIPINLIAGPGNPAAGGGAAGGAGGGAAGGAAGGVAADPTNGGRNPAGGALPPSFAGTCNRVFAQAVVIPASIREWINFNRDSLPEPPFMMEVVGRMSGISSAGDRFETQPMSLPITIVEEIFVTPTEGTDGTDTGTDGLADETFPEGTDGSVTDTETDASALEDMIEDAQSGGSDSVSSDL